MADVSYYPDEKPLPKKPEWLPEKKAAELIGETARWLAYQRKKGKSHPIYYLRNGRAKYLKSDVIEWIMATRAAQSS